MGTQRIPMLTASCSHKLPAPHPPTQVYGAHTRSVCATFSAPAILLGRKVHSVAGSKICLVGILECSQLLLCWLCTCTGIPQANSIDTVSHRNKGVFGFHPTCPATPPAPLLWLAKGTVFLATGRSGQLTVILRALTASPVSPPTFSFPTAQG